MFERILNRILDKCTFTSYLVVVMTLGFFGLIILVIFKEVPTNSQAFIYTSIGGIGGSVVTIVSFKFGSSSSSAKKDDAIIAQGKTNVT